DAAVGSNFAHRQQQRRRDVLFRAGLREGDRAAGQDPGNGDLETRAARERLDPVAFAAVWIALGDHDKALALLGRACADHEAMSDVKIAPEMDPVRADPRYHEILRCANLE